MSTSRLRPLALALMLVVSAMLLTACGNKKETILSGDTEGVYVDAGPLTYQVQISRQLNPRQLPDRTYLLGLPPGAATGIAPTNLWFAVFVRVSNEGDAEAPLATNFTIHDTQNKVFRPVALSASNPFAYRAGVLTPGNVYPGPNSVAAGFNQMHGKLVLFKLPYSSLQNRPLVLRIAALGHRPAEVVLDV